MTIAFRSHDRTDSLDIAIIGMSGRFPGARNVAEFWDNLKNGVESVHFFTDEELLKAGVAPALVNNPSYVKAAPILDEVDSFDAGFFDFIPSEARLLDPQRRLFLECAWEALEDAGYVPETFDGAIGVYASVGANHYFLDNLATNEDVVESAGGLQLLLSSDKDYFATQVSYKLNLTGPSISVQTACSSSLVAIHLARQSLLLGECDMALVGGSSINIPHHAGYLHQEGDIFSPDGHCRAFDAQARGTIFGSGCGIVVLKRLEDAQADGDTIRAVIIGSAINNDGSLKIGYTAPSVEGQAAVVVQGLASAGVTPDTIGYIEAHGTGTELGDPIEVEALTQAFRTGTQRVGFCAIGSVKTNVGHLNTAAGVAGVIKTALALEHGLLPPSLNYETPNPKIDIASSPFCVNSQLAAWEPNGWPRRAGVSSLGMGGTNAHVIMEESPVKPIQERESDSSGATYLLLSARSPTALEEATIRLADHLDERPDLPLSSVAFTLENGRRHFEYRRGLRCSSLQNGVAVLRQRHPGRLLDGRAVEGRPVVFLFPGQGTQYVGMGQPLYQQFPLFRQTMDRCADLLRPQLGLDLREVLFAGQDQAEEASRLLEQTRLAQPALFAVEYALAQLLMDWGIRPEAMIGHSLGEYVAACLADVFTLEEALYLVSVRGELMQSMPGGAMLSVLLSPEELAPWLDDGLTVAAVNAPEICAVSGETEAVEALQRRLEEAAVGCRRLHTSHAFHSPMMDPAVPLFVERVASANLRVPRIRYVSNVSGDWVTDEATDPAYWGRHLRQPVQFAQGLTALLQLESDAVFLEVGPGRGLCTLARILSRDRIAVQAMGAAGQDDGQMLAEGVLQLWLAGVLVRWRALHEEPTPQRIPLPTYPFERKRHWVESRNILSPSDLLRRKKPDLADWFYLPSWRRLPLPPPVATGHQRRRSRLIFVDQSYLGGEIAKRLRTRGDEVILVTTGDAFAKIDQWTYRLDPRVQDGYERLVASLLEDDKIPDDILHFWSVTPGNGLNTDSQVERLRLFQDRGFYSIFFLVKALGAQNVTSPINMSVFTNDLHDITGREQLRPEQATVLGQCKVVQQEYHNLICRAIDVTLSELGTRESEKLTANLINEIVAEKTDTVVAYRGSNRWVQAYEAVRVEKEAVGPSPIRPDGTYLITGGLFGIGLEIAEYLALARGSKLLIIEETSFPRKERWLPWLQQNDPQHLVSLKVRKAIELLEKGAQIMVGRADFHDKEGMRAVIEAGEALYGPINGIIHAAGGSATDRVGAISDTNRKDCERNLKSVAQGMVVLDELFRDRDLDFRLALGSLGSVLGGIGFVSYSAVSNFMVAFAQQQNRAYAQPWTVECWDSWTVEWETEERIASIVRSKLAERMLPTVITREEGLDCFERVFALTGEAQVAISATDLQARYDRWVKLEPIRGQDEMIVEPARHPRPPIKTSYVAPRDKLEQTIAVVFQELLGIDQVGVFDNFYDLGGHSLLATQLATRLREVFGMEFSLNAIAAGPTVSNLASAYAARKAILKVLEKRKASQAVADERL